MPTQRLSICRVGAITAQMTAGKEFKAQDQPMFTSALPAHPLAPFAGSGSECFAAGITCATRRNNGRFDGTRLGSCLD
jgi:hypothetical protein